MSKYNSGDFNELGLRQKEILFAHFFLSFKDFR